MKKILFFDFNIPALIANKKVKIGGATVQTLNWITGLNYNQTKTGVIVEKNEKTQCVEITDFIKSYSAKSGGSLSWFSPRIYQLGRSISKYKPDYLVQAGAGFILFPLSILALFNKVKFIHRIANNVDVDDRIYKKISYKSVFFYKIGLLLTPIISCKNNYQYRAIKSKFPRKKVIKVLNPYDTTKLKLKPYSLKERKYIAWVGIFQHQKNIPLLYKTAKKLTDIEFRIAGEVIDNPDKNTQNALSELKTLNNVTFVGYLTREKIEPFLSKALCLLNTSLYEGFPNTFLESFAVGTPVATIEDIDPDQIIMRHSLGKTTNNPNKLFECILKIINHDSYNEMSTRCLDYLIKNHDNKTIAAELLEKLKN